MDAKELRTKILGFIEHSKSEGLSHTSVPNWMLEELLGNRTMWDERVKALIDRINSGLWNPEMDERVRNLLIDCREALLAQPATPTCACEVVHNIECPVGMEQKKNAWRGRPATDIPFQRICTICKQEITNQQRMGSNPDHTVFFHMVCAEETGRRP
jgi:hypothetical protein